MLYSLLFKLLLSTLSTSFGILKFDFKFYSLEAAIGSASPDIGKLIAKVVDNFFLFSYLDAQLFFLTRHESCIILHLSIIESFAFGVSCFLVAHQFFKKALKFTYHSFLFLHGVFVKLGLLVFLRKHA